MKKLILKTALITLGILFLLSIAVFGILSLAAPTVMMDFADSVGLESIGGDYAWQEYERSGDIDCLARSFIVAAEHREDPKAEDRFAALYAREDFGEFCEKQSVSGEGVPAYAYRDYVCGQAARVKYRRAASPEAVAEAIDFAEKETAPAFHAGNPFAMLATEAASRKDISSCKLILDRLQSGNFEHNTEYQTIETILKTISEETANG